MNKKILAVAVISAMSASVAQADVKLSGGLQAELASLSGDVGGEEGIEFGDTFYGGGNYGSFAASWSDGDVYGKIGFNSTVTGGGSDGTREGYIGMKMGSVSVQAGKMNTLYKVTGGVKIDPFVATGLQARANGGQSTAHNGYGDTIQVKGKSGIVSWGIDFLPGFIDSSDGETSTTAEGGTPDAHFGLSLGVDIGEANVFFATDNARDNGDDSLTKFGAKMKFGKVNVAAQMESGLNEIGANGAGINSADETLTYITANMPLGGMTLAGWVGIADDTGTSFALGVKKAMTKKSSVYAGIRQTATASDDTSSTGSATTSSALVVGMRAGF